MTLTEPTRIIFSRSQIIPAVIGEPWGGGFFAGYISHTADGNPTHALIVAPRATGASGTGMAGVISSVNLQWKVVDTFTPNTTSLFDGAANTAAMVTAGIADHPAAQFCVNLSIGGFTDWYLPAPLEVDIAYFNLKPTAYLNSTTGTNGRNAYAVPRRTSNWTTTSPSQTSIGLFSGGGSEAFTQNNFWTSRTSGPFIEVKSFSDGSSVQAGRLSTLVPLRAFRRIAL